MHAAEAPDGEFGAASFSYDDPAEDGGAAQAVTASAFNYGAPATGSLANSIEKTPIGATALKPAFAAVSAPDASQAEPDAEVTLADRQIGTSDLTHS